MFHVKPYLKWAGGKRQLLADIKKQLPNGIDNYVYYEPFIGAGAVFFDLRPRKAVINDSNAQLIMTYNAIKESVDDLVIVLREHQKMSNERYYYEIRNTDRVPEKFNALSNIEKAARVIYLNKTCFNGLYRVNSKGHFNVPYGRYNKPAIFDEDALRQISEYFNSGEITILNGDFERAVSTANETSFVYFDPPYHSPDKTSFTGYQASGFDESEQRRLRDVTRALTNRGVKCLLSNSDTEYIRELYAGDFFHVISVQAKRAINSDTAGRGTVNEVLIKNF